MADFEFYGEEADERKETEIKGITGDVTDFTFSDLSYPCIIFNEDFSCPKHKLRVVSNMVKSTSANKDISLYFIKNGDLYKIGEIDGLQVSAFLGIVGVENVFGFYEKGIKLVGDKIYTLSVLGF